MTRKRATESTANCRLRSTVAWLDICVLDMIESGEKRHFLLDSNAYICLFDVFVLGLGYVRLIVCRARLNTVLRRW